MAVGQGHADELLGVHVELATKASAHAGGDNPELLFRHAQGEGPHDLQDVRDLGRRVERHIPVVGCRNRGHAARFHGRRDEPLVYVGLCHVVCGVLEGFGDGVGVRYQRPVVGNVGSAVLVDDHPVAGRVIEVDHGLERLVVDDHALGTVGGCVTRGGHHDGDCIACKVGLAYGHWEVGRVLHFVSDWPGTGQGSGPVAFQVGTGIDGYHAVGCQCGRAVDSADPSVGVGTAHA